MDDMMMKKGANMCACPHHKFIPGLVTLFGILFLLGNLGIITENLVMNGWPILVILAGLMKMGEGKCTCC